MSVTFRKPTSELIRLRYSCRNYRALPIGKHLRDELSSFISITNSSPFGTSSRFQLVAADEEDHNMLRKLGTYGFIKGAQGFIIGATRHSEKNLEDFGYSMERIILYATNLGLGTCWLGGTFTKSSFAQRISAQVGELVPAVVSVGYKADKPRWLETVVRGRAKADRRFPWERLFFTDDFNNPLTREAAEAYVDPLEMVRLAPSASNRQPWRVVKEDTDWHFFLSRTPGYRERLLVQLFTVADLQRIDMGIAMCHFELMAGELGLQGKWEVKEPEIEPPDDFTVYTATWVGEI